MTGEDGTILAADPAHVLNRLLDSSDLAARGIDPDRLGITDGTDELSFAGYSEAVARLAGALVDLGVVPGDRVAVHLRKSVWSFVTVHAVLRAGAVMVPLDPLAPIPHVRAVLTDAAASLLVTDAPQAKVEELVDGVGLRAVVSRRAVDRIDGVDAVVHWHRAMAHEPAVVVGVGPDEPAYIIYTSGSTGRPKGIVHTHASGWAYAARAVEEYALGPGDRLANVASLHFDQSTFELYCAPMVGASTIVVPDAVLRFPASVSELIEREGATVWYSVPYVLRQLSTRGTLADRDLSRLRWVLFGGELFPPRELGALMEQIPTASFSNVYGPAEVNQCCTHNLSTPPPLDAVVPIGRPWADTELAVVDDRDRPVCDGDVGELLVSTPTMMAGYWRRPDLTAAAMVDRGDGRRWYRTGDLVRRNDAGELVFLGRADHQVKIRGQRIEMEAVEAALLDLDAVAEVGVVAVSAGDETSLVAAVIPATERAEDEPFEAHDVTRRLARRLPAAAIPSAIVAVESLPRTASGKIDRPRLRARLADDPSSPTTTS